MRERPCWPVRQQGRWDYLRRVGPGSRSDAIREVDAVAQRASDGDGREGGVLCRELRGQRLAVPHGVDRAVELWRHQRIQARLHLDHLDAALNRLDRHDGGQSRRYDRLERVDERRLDEGLPNRCRHYDGHGDALRDHARGLDNHRSAEPGLPGGPRWLLDWYPTGDLSC